MISKIKGCIVNTSLVGDYFKENARHKFMGYQSAFMAIGGGLLSDISWRFPFGIYLIGFFLPYQYKISFFL